MDIRVEAKVKSPSEYRVVGKSLTRRDLPGKVYRAGPAPARRAGGPVSPPTVGGPSLREPV